MTPTNRFQPGIVPPTPLSGEHYWIAVDSVQGDFQEQSRILLLDDAGPCPFPLLRSFALTGLDAAHRHYLGTLDNRHVFAVALREQAEGQVDAQSGEPMAPPPGMYFADLRHLLRNADPILFALAGRARQIIAWARNHRFCSRCGQPTTAHAHDRAMVCTACDYAQYPRLAPCVIALVTRGDEILLARSPRFPEGVYSTLAGFIEAGENIEEALAREIREEVGVEIARPQYLASQSWPFPHSLMLGFHVAWAGGDIVVDGHEIVDAQWFSSHNLPAIPPPGSISRQLIDTWIATRRG